VSCNNTPDAIYEGGTWRQTIRLKTREEDGTESVRDLTGLAARGELRVEANSAAVFEFDSADGSIEIEAADGELTFVIESTESDDLGITTATHWILRWELYDSGQTPEYVEAFPLIRVPVVPR
jgi:hypothetical protein